MLAQVAPNYYSYPKKEFSGFSVNGGQPHPAPRQQAKLRIVDESYLDELQKREESAALSLDMQQPSDENLARFIVEIPDWINQSGEAEIVDLPRRSAFFRKLKAKENSFTASLLTSGDNISETGQMYFQAEGVGKDILIKDGKQSVLLMARKFIATTALLMAIAAGGYIVGVIAVSYENQPESVQVSQQAPVLAE